MKTVVVTVSMLLISDIFSSALAENAPKITSENWRDFEHTVCDPHPADPTAMRVVIFPPIIEAYDLVLEPPKKSAELIYEAGELKPDGTRSSPSFTERPITIPAKIEKRERLADHQYVGFLKENGDLYSENTHWAASSDYPLKPISTVIAKNSSNKIDEIVLWSNAYDFDETRRKSREAAMERINKAPNCSYTTYSESMNIRVVHKQRFEPNSEFMCSATGGYHLAAPRKIDIIEEYRVVQATDGGMIVYKTANGNVSKVWDLAYPSIFERQEPEFAICDWQKAR